MEREPHDNTNRGYAPIAPVGVGMGLGLAVGIGIGTALGNVIVGIIIGIVLGFAFSLFLWNRPRSRDQ